MSLRRERILRVAARLADEGGLDAVSMRRLGEALRVEAMSLYRHVTGKEDVLDGLADLVVSQFEVPTPEPDWKAAMRRSAISAHEVLLRHPWASGLIESRRSAGPARLRYLEAVIAVLAAAGFTMPMAVRAIMVLDSYVYGFVLQELAWPFEAETAREDAAAFARALPAGAYPNLLALAEMAASTSRESLIEFEFGLDLLLDGLDRHRAVPGA
ncbi:MAG TPA: TetR/AcrR family transcriptional regulator [Candidatus Limnocylindrales bacterium]|nr:TetR/AcrR family transcriptional regulator [Candidatus Limnocylindrales bacterium]